MDSGPFRGSRSDNKRPQAPVRPVAQPRTVPTAPAAANSASSGVAEEPVVKTTPSSRVSKASKFKKPKNGKKKVFIIIAALFLAIVLVFVFISSRGAQGIDSNKYQSVLLTNDQLYFGKLTSLGNGQFSLTDIYYLQAKSAADENEAPSNNNYNLRKFASGYETYDQEDKMIINDSEIIYYGNLKPDGRAAQAIDQYKKSSK